MAFQDPRVQIGFNYRVQLPAELLWVAACTCHARFWGCFLVCGTYFCKEPTFEVNISFRALILVHSQETLSLTGIFQFHRRVSRFDFRMNGRSFSFAPEPTLAGAGRTDRTYLEFCFLWGEERRSLLPEGRQRTGSGGSQWLLVGREDCRLQEETNRQTRVAKVHATQGGGSCLELFLATLENSHPWLFMGPADLPGVRDEAFSYCTPLCLAGVRGGVRLQVGMKV